MSALNLEQLKQLRPTMQAVAIDGVGTVMVRKFSNGVRDHLNAWFHANKGKDGLMLKNCEFKALVLSMGLCNEDGSQLLEPGDTSSLENLDAEVVDRLYTAVERLNGLGSEAAEEAEKNSASNLSSDSGTDSPAS